MQFGPHRACRDLSHSALRTLLYLSSSTRIMRFMSLAIETHQLTRYFDNFCAVSGIDLRVEQGTFYGFLGPNGAGKSTTIKMLTGLLAPTQGEMRLLGMN